MKKAKPIKAWAVFCRDGMICYATLRRKRIKSIHALYHAMGVLARASQSNKKAWQWFQKDEEANSYTVRKVTITEGWK